MSDEMTPHLHPPIPNLRSGSARYPLTAIEEAVAMAYTIHGNGVQTAKALKINQRTVNDILNKPKVHERVREIYETRFSELNVDGRRVVHELARIAFSDIRRCFDLNGDLLPMHMLSEDDAAAIASVDMEIIMRGRGDEAEPVLIKKIRRSDKLGALNTLARHFKVVGNEDDGVNNLANALADKLKAARKRVTGEVIDDAVEVVAEALTDATMPEPAMLPVPQGDDDEILW